MLNDINNFIKWLVLKELNKVSNATKVVKLFLFFSMKAIFSLVISILKGIKRIFNDTQ